MLGKVYEVAQLVGMSIGRARSNQRKGQNRADEISGEAAPPVDIYLCTSIHGTRSATLRV